ncbi:MAG: protein kinase [Verrucomicrobia bacterium]|nr:protein kinase [Verrucomicrobiota bacterium]
MHFSIDYIMRSVGFIFIVTEKKIGEFQILETIGVGGMGEVFLAEDPICKRQVALKTMREQWAQNKTMQDRFLREARIAAQLSHPSIIPIYSIDEKIPFYTMPRIEGDTLKEILRKTKEQSKKGEPLHPIGSSIQALVRIFLSICGAIAYVHSRNVLHRDLKPENIIVGKFGEVIILDWGLANFIGQPENHTADIKEENSQITQPGKIPGTLLYMAPERAFGAPSDTLSDIYSLGVMLYQILALQFPFQRKSLKEFKKLHEHETILPPEEAAPDRDISPHLSNIALKCLAKDPKERYQSVPDLIKDLENYIEGLPEWVEIAVLEIDRKEDWLFQENVALSKHMAITRGIDLLEWVNLMISKSPFPGNIKIETTLTLKDQSKGLGILFSIAKGIEESYCLWLSHEGVRLYRSNVEVLNLPNLQLEKNRPYHVKIEHIGSHVRFYLDEAQKFGFLSHIPLSGSHIGLIVRDGDFLLSPLQIAVGSQNIMVNCLAIPDAFLARKDYNEALAEYRKISDSFPGRAEGREATFRAGITLLKKASEERLKNRRETLYAEAHDEFEKLHTTPGAPLEYLGKSLVYKAQGEFEEEAKCLELALRKFPTHPLRPILIENVLSRLHEASQNNRQVAYRFALIVLRHLSQLPEANDIASVLQQNLEPLPFFISSADRNIYLMTQLAFWLNKPLVILELLEKGLMAPDIQNAQVALILLGCEELADLSILEGPGEELEQARSEYALKTGQTPLTPLWNALATSNWKAAKEIVETTTPEKFKTETDPHFFLYGCYLAHEKGQQPALAHLTNISERAFPPTNQLLSHYLIGRNNLKKGWIASAFFWEKLKLMQQLELFSHCLGDETLKKSIKSIQKQL